MTALSARLRRFLADEDGLVLVEFLLLLPLMVWAFIGLFIYWDAFRTINEAQKASYAVADLMSRQSDVSESFVNGMDDVMGYMMTNTDGIRVRVTSIEWDEDDNEYYVLFSRSPGSKMTRLTTSGMTGYSDRIPVMADHDSVLMIETEVNYAPIFNVGINEQTLNNLIITRPRYYRRVCLTESMSTCPENL